MSRSLRLTGLIGLMALVILMAASAIRSYDSKSSSEPAGVSQKPFFVGTTSCIGCHEGIGHAHAASGHGNTFHSTADFAPRRRR
ncbi:MAG: hypothetical protein R3C49_02365 [Planctomycetaceae bacterium]